jgi:hypothetical protein
VESKRLETRRKGVSAVAASGLDDEREESFYGPPRRVAGAWSHEQLQALVSRVHAENYGASADMHL